MLAFPKVCADCHFYKAKVSCKSVEKICGCTKPELKALVYSGIGDYGICKNCGHYVIRTSKSWEHHRKAYYCDHPYCDNKCFAPVDVIALLEPPKVPEKEGSKKVNVKKQVEEKIEAEQKKEEPSSESSINVVDPNDSANKDDVVNESLAFLLDNIGLGDIED